MTVQAWIIMTPTERAGAIALNTQDYRIEPFIVTNSLANNLGYGVLVGQYVNAARILMEDGYAAIWAGPLGSLPVRVMDSDTLFLPPEPEE